MDKTLELNCASTKEPDSREFLENRHTAIVFDEAEPGMVLRHKKLFQGPAALVSMASSATNCHIYSVWLNGVKLIICSNNWHLKLTEVAAVDAEWLNKNSVHVFQMQRMWRTDGGAANHAGA